MLQHSIQLKLLYGIKTTPIAIMEQIQDFTPTLNKPTASGQLEPLQDAISTDFEGILDEMRTEIATSQEINTQVYKTRLIFH